ncbi:MAG: MBL fold metallo-hydrolase [Opitutaceae bacterium]|jgi:L-ascorbate metabolism protein UlaG (beta-lactamase superfamily)
MQFRFLLPFVASTLIVATNLSPAAEATGEKSTRAVSLTYIANEGLLITGANEKVLIDSIFTNGFGIWDAPSPELLEKIKTALPPFDHVTCVLATHADADHFSATDTLQHLLSNPASAFFAPLEVTQQLHQLPQFDQVKARVHPAAQSGAPTEQRIVAGLVVRAVPLEHLTRPPTMPPAPYNVGHLFTIDGIKFFHTGDMGSQNLQAFQHAKLREEQVDVAIVNCYFFDNASVESALAVLACLNPKVVLLAHLPRQGFEQETDRILKLPGMPRMIALNSPMQAYAISKKGSELLISKN